MAKFVYRLGEGRGSPHADVQAENGEVLSAEKALIVLLDLIDSRLFGIQQALEEFPSAMREAASIARKLN